MNILITGAGRGIGLELASHYQALGHQVLGTVRSKQHKAALETKGIRALELDLTQQHSVLELAEALKGQALDLIVNNAGVLHAEADLDEVDAFNFAHCIQVNSLGPLLLSRALLPNLLAGKAKKLAFISSLMGSVGDNGSGGYYSYRASKAALNAVAKSLAVDLAPEGVRVGLYHPGWVQTDMGGPRALIDTATSVAGLTQRIEELDEAASGRFLNYDGKPLPW
ncbi:SDR family oxidoreductase [Gallaecimonas kandeliae]|uniref:SDR family oxidoreductase n=1 Tax=Gallaecimonas kandeliae TaxID=3029055 RepID=UPI00264A0D19|nr:SDR family oxidoreductase [Gallaecimonas kandeliae]WKE64548.1 SDR family oxidoreductase [Gallaecimonas kandeliae]